MDRNGTATFQFSKTHTSHFAAARAFAAEN
jgi:hypothetical protein